MNGWIPSRTGELRAVINRLASVEDANHDLHTAVCELLANAPLDDETRRYLRKLRDWASDDAGRIYADKKRMMKLLDEVSP